MHNPSKDNTMPEGHKASDSITVERRVSEQIDTKIVQDGRTSWGLSRTEIT
jgi:hypothetical protein